MSPEQAAGDLERLGPRSDVYSLGATLYFRAQAIGHRHWHTSVHKIIRHG
jgi:hypothetical protein